MESPPPGDKVLELRSRLKAVGYTEEKAEPFLRRLDGAGHRAALLHSVHGPDSADVMCRLWLMSQWVDRQLVSDILSEELLQRACQWALLADFEGRVGATVDLYPLGDDIIITDRQLGAEGELEVAYPLGGDSYMLSRLIPDQRVARALDLCTGSGIQALSVTADLVHAVEITDRASQFARFNFRLNRPPGQCEVFQGNLYDPLPPGKYDLVVTNPPWVPAPTEGVERYRGGGQDGERVVQGIIEGLEQRLAPGGSLLMYVEYPEYVDETYHQRLRKWLGEGTWGIATLRFSTNTASEYVQYQVGSHEPSRVLGDYCQWMTVYEKERIQGMSRGVVCVQRAEEAWDVLLESEPPAGPQSWVSDWLKSLSGDSQGSPELVPDAVLWISGDRGRVEWPKRCLKPLDLTPQELAVVRGDSEDAQLRQSLRRRMVLA